MGRLVRDLMSSQLVTIEHNETLDVADALFTEHRIRHLPVVDGEGTLVGVLTRRDVFRTAIARAFGFGSAAQDKLLRTLKVKEVMTSDPKSVSSDAALSDAAEIMMTEKYGCLPVVDGDKLTGILTESDFVRACLEEA